ncbi:MAG TPA: Lrp/AsnC family transcriptional regulator [Rhizomicrobium sp.]|jgi:Lrp/AsnC family transcriptional regulator|nr:Lrp/AsnC family transcriptional regulator [Rhizomicrobium sp.]
MTVANLDAMDVKILDLLQEDAARSIAEIAERIHLSHNACWRRIRQLEESGIIRKRVALLDAEKLGVGNTVFVLVRAAEYTDEWYDAFAAAVKKIPEVLEFYRLAGEIDYLLKLQVSDIADYNRVSQALTRAVRFRDFSGAFAMEELKNTTAIPLPRK